MKVKLTLLTQINVRIHVGRWDSYWLDQISPLEWDPLVLTRFFSFRLGSLPQGASFQSFLVNYLFLKKIPYPPQKTTSGGPEMK